MKVLNIIGGGLAGSEAAWQAANLGIKVKLYELRKDNLSTPAHKTNNLAELVCSNSFRNDDLKSAVGILHQEMRILNSLVMSCADNTMVPAGSALAVDRELFSKSVEEKIFNHPNIEVIAEEISDLGQFEQQIVIVASGPLTSEKLSKSIAHYTGQEHLAFFDAIAPIVYKDSIDFSKAWFQSRYNKIGPGGNGKDYINCPLSKDQYYEFVDSLINSETTEFKEWEKDTPYFDGCLPIEVMAARGKDTLSFGPMKPVGLDCPHDNIKPYAVVQLRQDNKEATLYNIVGFQTKIKYQNQTELLRKIPGLENAEFARLGGIHRNSFIKSPILLDNFLRLKTNQNVYFAGQITGVEGYVESASMGLLAGIFAANNLLNNHIEPPSPQTAIGALLNYITISGKPDSFQPMNINFGLFSLPKRSKHLTKEMIRNSISEQALDKIKEWGQQIMLTV